MQFPKVSKLRLMLEPSKVLIPRVSLCTLCFYDPAKSTSESLAE